MKSDLDIRQMRYFIATAECGSLAAAAGLIGITQPSLSQQIKLMERQLGVELLVRTSRGVELTEAGRLMLLHARRISAAVDCALEEVRLAGTEAIGKVVFGFPSSVSMVLSVPLAETLRLEHPQIRFRAVEAMSGFIKEWLTDGSIDLAVLYDTNNLKNIHTQLLLTEKLQFYSAVDSWPFASRPGEPVTLADVVKQELVLPCSNHGLRSLIDNCCKANNLVANVVIEMDSLSQLLSLVSRGSGSTILAPAAAHEHLELGKLASAPIMHPEIQRPVFLARNSERMVTRATREVETLTLQIVRELVVRGRWMGRLIS